MIVLGLTGSIAMGKSTTAGLFGAQGAAVYDADAAVHTLYDKGGAAGAELAPLFPEAVDPDGAVRREALRALLAEDPARLPLLEATVFPLVAAHRRSFLAHAGAERRSLAVMDIPLLFETGMEDEMDAVVVVTADPDVQRARALARPGVDQALFDLLSARQIPDAEKRRRADFLVETDRGLEDAARQVRDIVQTVLEPGWRPPRGRAVAKSPEVSDINRLDPGGRE